MCNNIALSIYLNLPQLTLYITELLYNIYYYLIVYIQINIKYFIIVIQYQLCEHAIWLCQRSYAVPLFHSSHHQNSQTISHAFLTIICKINVIIIFKYCIT
jgi:hypothetical protein